MQFLSRVALSALLLVGLVPARADAAEGFDSAFFAESAFLTLQPGQSDQFVMGFTNMGSVGWTKGNASHVNLAQCCPVNTASPNSAWNPGSWVSNTAYATQGTDYVGPRQVGWFTYAVRAPLGAAPGSYRFDGDLVLAFTGEPVHREGAFQIATVIAAAPVTSGPVASALQSAACLNLREIKVQFSQEMVTSGTGSIADPEHFTLSGGVDVDGARPAADGKSVVLTVGRSITGSASHDGAQLSSDPATYLAQNTTYSLTVRDVGTSALRVTAASSTPLTCTDSGAPAASIVGIPGSGTVLISFTKPVDPRSFDNAIFLDSIPIATLAKLRWQDRSGNVCGSSASGCFTRLRLDFQKGGIPSQGDHLLEIRDAKDAAGFRMPPGAFRVGFLGPASAAPPPVTSVTPTTLGGGMRIDVVYGESMALAANGFAAGDSVDNAANYILRNPDGSAATGGGGLVTIDRVLPDPSPTSASIPADERALAADALAFALQKVRLVLGPTTAPALRPNVDYTLEIRGPKDQGGMPVAPGTILTVRWPGDTTPPRALRAYATSQQLRVDYSESMLVNPQTLASTNANDPARYTSTDAALKSSLTGMSFARLTADGTGAIFNFFTPLATATYTLDINGVQDPFGNVIAATRLSVTAVDTIGPTLVGATKVSAAELRVTFSERVKETASDPGAATNPSNYSVDNGIYGSLCVSGAATVTAETVAFNGQQSVRIACNGNGAWSATGTHNLTVKDVQDVSGNVVTPNPAGPVSFQ